MRPVLKSGPLTCFLVGSVGLACLLVTACAAPRTNACPTELAPRPLAAKPEAPPGQRALRPMRPCPGPCIEDIVPYLVEDGFGQSVSYVSGRYLPHVAMAPMMACLVTEPAASTDTRVIASCGWPPPKPSARYGHQAGWLENSADLGCCCSILTRSLLEAGFPSYGICESADLGFAVITPLERIRRDGTPFEGAARFRTSLADEERAPDETRWYRCFLIGVVLPETRDQLHAEPRHETWDLYAQFRELLSGPIRARLSDEVAAVPRGDRVFQIGLYYFSRRPREGRIHYEDLESGQGLSTVAHEHARLAGLGGLLAQPAPAR